MTCLCGDAVCHYQHLMLSKAPLVSAYGGVMVVYSMKVAYFNA